MKIKAILFLQETHVPGIYQTERHFSEQMLSKWTVMDDASGIHIECKGKRYLYPWHTVLRVEYESDPIATVPGFLTHDDVSMFDDVKRGPGRPKKEPA